MNSPAKTESLRSRLLLPLLAACLLVGGGGALLLQNYYATSLKKAAEKQIESMSDALNLAAESSGDLTQLQRYTSMMAAQRGVKLIIVASSASKQVITSSKHALINSYLAGSVFPEPVRNAIGSEAEAFYFDIESNCFWLVRNIRLVNLDQVSTLGNSKLIIQVEASQLVDDLKTGQFALVGWLGMLIAALLGVSWYALQYRVLQRTAAIARTLASRKQGIRDARVKVDCLDELGVMADALNQMLDQQDRFDAMLSSSNEALSKSEERYRLIVETTQEGVWLLNNEHRIVFANNRLAEMLETQLDDVLERVFTDFIPERFRAMAIKRLEKSANHELDRYDVQLVTRTGKELWVTCSSTPLFDELSRYKGMLGMVINISERIEAEIKLKENQQKLQEIFSHSTDTIFIVKVGEQDEFLYEEVNLAFETETGISREYAVGRSPQELFTPDVANEFLSDFRNCVEKRTPVESDHSVRFDGAITYLNSLLVPILDDNGLVCRIYGFARDVTARREAEERAVYLAQHDNLTGLPNRTLLRDRLDQALLRAEVDHNYVAMMFLDLDRFKSINDSFGHPIGDAFLKEVSQRLTRCVRSVDTVSRQGGDEFLLVLPDLTSLDEVAVIAKSILACLDDPFEVEGFTVVTSFSIGISIYPSDTKTATGLLRNADTALMHAKQSGRNTYRFFTEAMNVNSIERLQLETQLRKAFSRNEFSLHFQPQIELQDNSIIGAEALIRWTHPTMGNIPPGRFISVAEDSGLIVQLGEWVLNEAVRQNMEWQNKGYKPFTIAVNISAVQFKRDDLITLVKNVLARHGMAPNYLELELTESILLEDVGHTLETVLKLKQLGVQLSIDDFGTGYSSLSYLKRFAVEKLKIDQSFVRDLATDPEDAAIVHAIIQLGRSLQLKTIAEGVETQAQLDFLAREGCDEVQGYFFCRPVPAESFEAILRDGLNSPRCAI